MRTLPTLLGLLAALVALPACDMIEDNVPTLAGDFAGTVDVDGVATAFALGLNSTVAGNVTGAGTVTTPDVQVPVTVSGNVSYPSVTLQLTPTDASSSMTFEPITGTVNSDFSAITATYGGTQFTLTK